MEIATLEDLKEALKDIPDDVLERFGAGINVEGGTYVELLCWNSGEDDEVSMGGYYREQEKKYPQIKDIGKLIKNIAKEQSKFEKDHEDEALDRDSPISSTDNVEIKDKE